MLLKHIFFFSERINIYTCLYIASMSSDLMMMKLRTHFPNRSNKNICKYATVCAIIILAIVMFVSSHPDFQLQAKWRRADPDGTISSPTNISHIVFGIAGSSNTWKDRRWYVDAWWKPNVTRGFLFLERAPVEHMPWPSTHPPYRISEDNSRYRDYNKHRVPSAIRMVRVIEETFKAEKGGEARWYVMADDDTVLLLDNLVGVLSKYDHSKYFYIGMNSECFVCNAIYSFGMAFGGAGYALSYPLAKAVVHNMDLCIKRYPYLSGSDHMLQSCIADLGVSLTQENGFHQIDFRKDISGLLSAHPHSALLSLHHLDAVDPLFPSTNRTESLNLLMKAAAVDESRLLQQSICRFKKYNWTISVAWGYSVQIYETIIPPSQLYRPVETFGEWIRGAWPPYMLNARPTNSSSCNLFFFSSAAPQDRLTTYTRTSPPPHLPPCSAHSAANVTTIRLISPSKKLDWQQDGGGRRECCDVVTEEGMDSLLLKLRDCGSHEMLL